MDISTALWVAWVAAFVLLEAVGLRSGSDRSFTLTNRIRAAMTAHPGLRWIIRAGVAAGLLWLAAHFLLIDPVTHPGA